MFPSIIKNEVRFFFSEVEKLIKDLVKPTQSADLSRDNDTKPSMSLHFLPPSLILLHGFIVKVIIVGLSHKPA